MPTYQYACTECDERPEAVQKFTDDPLTVCEACGGPLRKVYSAVGIVFKGSGFYRTDSRNGSGPPGAKEPGAKEPGAKEPGAKDKQATGSGDGSAKGEGSGSADSGSSSGEKSGSGEGKTGKKTGTAGTGSSGTGSKVA